MRLIAVILPYAVSIRDFVHSGVLLELLTVPDLKIQIYTQNPDLPEFQAVRSARVEFIDLPVRASGRFEQFLKRIYPVLFYDIFVHVQQSVDRTWLRRMRARLIVGMRRLIGTRAMLKLFAALLRMSAPRTPSYQLRGEPRLVISTRSLLNSLDYPLLLEAVERKLPHLTLASSWDNFTTKGFFPFGVDRTIVWNRQMANELTEIFAVAPRDIVVAGYPRVRLLENRGAINGAEQYLNQLGLIRYRRFILYSASYGELTRTHPTEAPKEFQLIREVATTLARTLPDDTAIIVRLHPYSLPIDETFFDGIPRVHLFVPGRRDQYVERVMSKEDEVHLSAQIKFSECIISMASTITIDALSQGRPIINVAFDPSTSVPGENVIGRFYEFNHFRDLLRAVKPPMAKNVQDVVDFVGRCMAGDQNPKIDQAAFESLYVPKNSSSYPQIVRDTVVDILMCSELEAVAA